MALRHAVLSGLSCGGENGRSALQWGRRHPKARHPAGLTHRSHGRPQLVQPVPQPARGLLRRIHLQGERRREEQPRSAAAELARGRALGEALTQPRTSSRAWAKKARGRRRTSAKLGSAGSSSMAVVRFSSAATSATRSDICGRGGVSRLETRSTGAGGWGSRRPARGCGWMWERLAGEECPLFLQHHLTLTGRSTAFHFRWKSLVLHLRLFTCRHKPRERLKNFHGDSWQCCTTLAGLEGSETRTKFGPASFMSPDTFGKTSSSSPNCCRKHVPCHLGLEFSVPSALPPASPQPPIASSTHKLFSHLVHSLLLLRCNVLVLGQPAALPQGVMGKGSPQADPQHQHEQWGEAEAQHFGNESSTVSDGARWRLRCKMPERMNRRTPGRIR